MSDLQYWTDILTNEVFFVENNLQERKLGDSQERLDRAEGAARAFKMEVRLTKDPKERRNLDERLKKMSHNLRVVKDKLELFHSKIQVDDGQARDPVRDGDLLLAESMALQDETQNSLTRIKTMIGASKSAAGRVNDRNPRNF